MKVINTLLTFFLFINALLSQQEANYWYLGDHAGITFESGSPTVLLNSSMFAEAGCTVISDKNGKLQFYTNGKEIWNKNHAQMPEGFGINGSQILNQNSLIIPFPDSSDIYYLFSVNANFDSLGLTYSIVDMQLENGLGNIRSKNNIISNGLVEKITSAKHCNGEDIWIVGHNKFDRYLSFLFTSDSLQKEPIQSKTGSVLKADIGYMKMSPASNRIAMPINNANLLVELSRFHNRSGKVYDPIRIFAQDSTVYAYGIEFSPDGNMLYVSTGGKSYKLWQYDISLSTEAEINASAGKIAEGNHFAMQLAPDGKIYIAKENRDYLSAIVEPDQKGVDCNYREYFVALDGRNCRMGLPNFSPYYFYEPSFDAIGTCLGDTSIFQFPQFENSDSLKWFFGDGSPVVTTQQTALAKHEYKRTKLFQTMLLIYHCGVVDSIIQEVEIYDRPVVALRNDTIICNGCSLILNGGGGMDYWIWQDGSESQYYEAWEEGLYEVLVSRNECTATDSIYIYKGIVNVVVPNAFSPNGDGLNDLFAPVSSEVLMDYRLQIFDRWGNLLFETTKFDKGWNGQYANGNCSKGVYNWKLSYSYYNKSEMARTSKIGTVLLLK